MKKLIFIATLFFILSACTKNKNLTEVLIEYDKLSPVDFFSPKYFSDIKPISLNTDTTIFGESLYLKIKNGSYYIFDQQQSTVSTYSSDGNLTSIISNIGRGPGEYLFIRDFYIEDNNTIVLLCNNPPKVIKYSQSGTFIEEFELPFNAMSFIRQNDSYWFFKERTLDETFKNNTLIETDKNFKTISSHLPMREMIFEGFAEKSFSLAIDNSILLKHTFDETIYRINEDTIAPAYKLNWGSLAYPEQFFIADDIMDAYDVFSNTTSASIYAAFENTDYLLLYVEEAGLEQRFGYLLYNRKTGNILFEKFRPENIIVNTLGCPKALTNDNAIVFVVDVDSLEDLALEIPLLSKFEQIPIKGKKGYILLKFYIK